ncbi:MULTISPECIES: helix-turn-helix domain-containing protein [Aminobacter]|uniref:Transcriptional regulator/DNA-binding XRE family transcriptional regulator n=1 Tax=Aminobacter niigataensis TaxID=83265 RepID=A0ABR6L4W4_9HYPH|nr:MULTISPECIES: helix-turn-helix domain-containing protein [Aminobacter]AWC21066.1 Antitoxin HigA [Aminobacter sp. MSH1]MBB4651224.1 putative transcriptional regulator/DNA-binding XRE family transcriptional regulator [Aminobacter niigataensis]CAI2931694.1 Antitoxin HigA [Aminobacter niigataensis]
MQPDRKIVEAVRIGDGDAGRVVGLSLKALRQAVGLTQLQMAERLSVGQAAISKIEQRGDVQISSLQRYVEALGARLRIDAAFPSDIGFAAEALQQITGARIDNDDQYLLPIFGDDRPLRRDVILSIKPAYSDKILEGVKTVELRRRFPLSVGQGATAYIYSTSPVRALVGAAEITDVERLPLATLWRRHGKSASIRKLDFDAYFGGLSEGYALNISNVRRFSHPLNLIELKERFGFKAPQSFLYAKPNLQMALQNEHTNISN